MSTRLLVTGVTGTLGGVLHERARAAGWHAMGTSVATIKDTVDARLDIRDAAMVREVFATLRPDVVVHTATGRNREDWATTADGAANIAVAAAAADVRLVHVSSDAVLAESTLPQDESALPNPLTRYGAAKAAAETAVRAVTPSAAIVRTGIILGHGVGHHERLTHDLIHGYREGFLFTDMIRHVTHLDDLSDALLELAAGQYAGILNVAGPKAVSRYELGVLVARRDGLDPARIPSARAADTVDRFAGEVRLDTDRARSLLRTRLRGVDELMNKS